MAKQALVTGSDGFVGRHLVDALDERGYRVLEVDITRGNDAIKFFQRNTDRFDLVAHAAYVVGGRATIDGRNTALVENELLDASLFDWALRTRQKAVLYFSSSAAYPISYQNPTSGPKNYYPTLLREEFIYTGPGTPEDNFGLPDANYGFAKLNGERLARVAGENGLRVHVVRPFSGYGSDQSLDYPFPSIIRRAVEGDYEVWGPKGQSRDWIHIDDVIEGSLVIYENDERRPVNLCTGRAVEMGELMLMAWREANPGDTPGELVPGDDIPQITYLTDKPTGVFYRVGDPARMNEHYTAKITIEEGVKNAIQRFNA